jgi:carboxyl-terminal processing protease
LRSLSLSLGLLLLLAPATLAQVRARDAAGLDRDTQGQAVLDLLGPEHVLREAWRVTTRSFYDKARLPGDWEQVRERYQREIAAARTPEEAHAVINAMLGNARTSHLALIERRVFLREVENEFRNRPIVRAGCELEEVEGRLFVCGVTEGGPAAEAGLVVGDEVVSLDGTAPAASGRLDPAGHDPALGGGPYWFLRPDDPPAPIALEVRREQGGAPRALSLLPRPTSQIESCRASARVEQVADKRVGVIRLWHFMHSGVSDALKDAIAGPFAAADALVLDVRGRGGSTLVVNAVMAQLVGARATWHKPVVVLTDRGTRSAKEIFAWQWKRRGRGPIVGERTAGACVGCTFRQLSDGSILALPIQDVTRLTQGEDLEGAGVEPTEPVAQLPLPFRGGRDAILEAGLARAAALAQAPAQPRPGSESF